MLELMTQDDFEKLLQGPRADYYKGRWEYYKEVIQIIKNEKIESVLEIGPGKLPIVKNCDIMIKPEDDRWQRPDFKAPKEYLHNATKTPWPIEDKKYDLFIALQVWEHLEGFQKEAFKEVMRIAKMAIFSLPYMWDCPKDSEHYPSHHMINEKIIAEWTLNVKPEKIIKIGRTGPELSKGPRIIYFWKF